MTRTLVTIVTTAALVVVGMLLLAAAPAAPRWPAASLDYYTAASEQLEIISEQSGIAFSVATEPDSADTLSETVTAVTAGVKAINDLEPPVALLAFDQQSRYAATTCQRAVKYSQTAQFEGMAAMASIPIYTQFGTECFRALNEAFVEGARYASTVGGFPEEE